VENKSYLTIILISNGLLLFGNLTLLLNHVIQTHTHTHTHARTHTHALARARARARTHIKIFYFIILSSNRIFNKKQLCLC